MTIKAFIRRNWLRLVMYGGLLVCAVDGFLIEPHWLKINRLSLSEHPSVWLVHISDIHYKGDKPYLMRVVAQINQLAPNIVCFTGDIAENTLYLEEALNALGEINAPLYGVPGNHEYWSHASFKRIRESFRKKGGDWLVDTSIVTCGGKCLLVGLAGEETANPGAASEFAMPGRRMDWNPVPNSKLESASSSRSSDEAIANHGNSSQVEPGAKRVLLTHYPVLVNTLKKEKYDLILSGHAHGGQVRLPLWGAVIVPFAVDGYELGTYMTESGRLHVSSGVGTFFLQVRFFCRPEITLIEL